MSCKIRNMFSLYQIIVGYTYFFFKKLLFHLILVYNCPSSNCVVTSLLKTKGNMYILFLPCSLFFLIFLSLLCACRYAANKSMSGCAFCNADGDFLVVPQKGSKYSLFTQQLDYFYMVASF